YTQPPTAFDRVKGLVTGTKLKVLDGSQQWLRAVTYYDDRYRVIQSVSDNHMGGVERISNLYDFTGKVLKTKTSTDDITVKRKFEYDHAGRLLKTWHQTGDAPA